MVKFFSFFIHSLLDKNIQFIGNALHSLLIVKFCLNKRAQGFMNIKSSLNNNNNNILLL